MALANLQPFPLSTREDIGRFEGFLDSYVDARTNGLSIAHFSLANAFDELQADSAGPRLFAALVDIRISLALLVCDAIAMGRNYNRTMPQVMEERGPLSDVEAFELRMEIHAHSNAFILRFRSLWDKIMGLLVLRLAPAEYDRFASAKSKKATFRKIMAAANVFSPEFIGAVEATVQKFDDSYRTAEAHGTGVLRKSSFDWVDHESSPARISGYWNFLNQFAHAIGGIFDPEVRARLGSRESDDAP